MFFFLSFSGSYFLNCDKENVSLHFGFLFWGYFCASYYFDTDENINANAYIKAVSKQPTNEANRKKIADKIYFYVFYVYVLCSVFYAGAVYNINTTE